MAPVSVWGTLPTGLGIRARFPGTIYQRSSDPIPQSVHTAYRRTPWLAWIE
ncbi:hypothetical protein BH20ACT23_BH20ACT23_29410 [soil metagenome]